jgi:hypothetical protein
MTTIDANNKPSAAVDTSNVIPFPNRCAAHKQPEITEPQTFSRPLRRAVHKAKDALLHLVRSADRVRAQRTSGSVVAAPHHPEHHQAPVLDHRGRAIRERVSA